MIRAHKKKIAAPKRTAQPVTLFLKPVIVRGKTIAHSLALPGLNLLFAPVAETEKSAANGAAFKVIVTGGKKKS